MNIPRWQQCIRSWAFGDVWDRMTPKDRRFAFFSDIIVGLGGAFLMYALFGGFN